MSSPRAPVPGDHTWSFETTDLPDMPTQRLVMETGEFFDLGLSDPAPSHPLTVAPGAFSGEMSEEEFERMLDTLRGQNLNPTLDEPTALLPMPAAPRFFKIPESRLARMAGLSAELVGLRNRLLKLRAQHAEPSLSALAMQCDALTRLLVHEISEAYPVNEVQGHPLHGLTELLLVGDGEDRYALPLACVNLVTPVAPGALRILNGRTFLVDGARVLYCQRLTDTPVNPERGGHAVRVWANGAEMALLVDEVLGREEGCVTSLPQVVRASPWCTGATVCGDGIVAVVVDPAARLADDAADKTVRGA